jgi:D-glycero-D-manno-heptose 1,7-bisphosphate phosphatase
LALPFVAGYSTTELIKKIRLQQGMPAEPRRAVFLDRDGVINIDRSYVHRWEDFEFVPGAVDAVRRLKAAGYMVVVVTNQAGLARGLYTEAEYAELTRRMRLALSEGDADVDAVYHCPHHLGGSVATLSINCECRKPAPGMLLQAARDLNLSLPDSILIGDKPSDIEAARRAELRLAYGVHSNNAESGQQVLGADATFDSLAACVDHLLSAGITPQV